MVQVKLNKQLNVRKEVSQQRERYRDLVLEEESIRSASKKLSAEIDLEFQTSHEVSMLLMSPGLAH
jgi:hypothetical protein